ncbi:MAG TPA: adenosylmethionine decarboxylase [Atribacteraceae bacterium]|nr:adenosylmethionine decarboxylase [Atribacteraceae bacterium]
MNKVFEAGTHLVLDGYSTDQALLNDMERIRSFLDECPGRMGMTKITPPYVFRYRGNAPQENGVSGIVIIAESHISIHTFPDRNYLSVDVFSCKPFDVEEATRYLIESFGVNEFHRRVLDRGVEYPKDLKYTVPLVLEERLENLEKLVHT